MGHALFAIEHEYVDPVDRSRLLVGALRGMVAELDPHSSYMDPSEFQRFDSDTQGQFGGIGIEVENRAGSLVVLAPIEGAPAQRAGLRAGDVIASVDGRDPVLEPIEKLVMRLRGAPGTHIKVGIRRPPSEELKLFDLVRDVVHVPSVSFKLLTSRVAYVRVKQFQEHTHDELLEAAAHLRERSRGSLDGILLDLRGDPGGLVDQAADVADEFLGGGIIYTTRHRGEVVDTVVAHSGGAFDTIPCVVLVDPYTASAAELVAAALQDHRRATVVGQVTFGKGSVQAVMALPGGSGMRITVARYYTPAGRAIQADGVHPDVRVDVASDGASASEREMDLDGHLVPESPAATMASPQGRVVVVDAGVPREVAESNLKEANVPDDPSQSADVVLRVGWDVLRKASHAR